MFEYQPYFQGLPFTFPGVALFPGLELGLGVCDYYEMTNCCMQFTVKSLNENWDGCLTFGVTSISPDRAGGVEAAIHLKHSTFIMCTQKEDEKYQTHLFIDSKVQKSNNGLTQVIHFLPHVLYFWDILLHCILYREFWS